MPHLFWDIQGLFLTGKRYRGEERKYYSLGKAKRHMFTGVHVNLPSGFYGITLLAFQ